VTAAAPSLFAALHCAGPAPDRAAAMRLYGGFIGDWEMDAVYHLDDGSTRQSRGAIHFGWILEGRAIQDVWIVPARDAACAAPPSWRAFYGTTLRVYDPRIDAWHILWIDPVRQTYRRMTGQAHGADIVQDGEDETGVPVRWSFTEIAPASFHWLAERSPDGGKTWRLLVEFFARRAD
jgi:hypothetical protein